MLRKRLKSKESSLLKSQSPEAHQAAAAPSSGIQPPKRALTLEEKRDLFKFAYTEHYPPHIAAVLPKDQNLNIFDKDALDVTRGLLSPGNAIAQGSGLAPNRLEHRTFEALERRNKTLRSQGKKNMFSNFNVGHRDDWYTDAVFGQQQLTGTNPTTITIATPEWCKRFAAAAEKQGLTKVVELINTSESESSLYVQDYSDIRLAIANTSPPTAPDAVLQSADGKHYACVSVGLFRLETEEKTEGKMHPVAIILDFKVSIENSVTIFNRRLTSNDIHTVEATEWPWRYAKMCLQCSDWVRHEITIHLINTHLVEETVIVAAHRTLPPDHPAFLLLEPHWATTLSLNELARKLLVPHVIGDLVGFSKDQLGSFMF